MKKWIKVIEDAGCYPFENDDQSAMILTVRDDSTYILRLNSKEYAVEDIQDALHAIHVWTGKMLKDEDSGI